MSAPEQLGVLDEAAPHREPAGRDRLQRREPARLERDAQLALAQGDLRRRIAGGEPALQHDELAHRIALLREPVGVDQARCVVVGGGGDRGEQLGVHS